MNQVSIIDFGAIEGTLSTQSIQRALEYASDAGLTVVIPKGIFYSGTLDLKKASLYLEKGAVLKASENVDDYYANGFIHNEMHECISFLYSMSNVGVSITGEGTIDLSADVFYNLEKRNVPTVEGGLTKAQIEECPASYTFRPTQPIFFYQCDHLRVEGVKIVNSPCWTLSFHDCENVHVVRLTIENSLVIPNNDGLHFCGCRKVFVSGCNISSGDDCIALTGITNWDIPCEDVVISDCILRSCSKAISIGYMHSIVRNVLVSNCIILQSNRPIALMASEGTGLIEHVILSNLRLDSRIYAGNWWGNGEPICIFALYHDSKHNLMPKPTRNWPVNITDVNISCVISSGENAIGIIGSHQNIQNISIHDLSIECKDSANRSIKGDRAIDVSPSCQRVEMPDNGELYWLYVKDCKNISIQDARPSLYQGRSAIALFEQCENVCCENLQAEMI